METRHKGEMMRHPFDFEHADPWASEIIDVESLNAKASDLIRARIEQVRQAARRGPDELRSTSLLVLGTAGCGKTHLFVRVRRKCSARAAFVLVRPQIGVDPTPRQVLKATFEALARPASGVTDRQLDVIVGSLIASISNGGKSWPHVVLDELKAGSAAAREEAIAGAIDHVESLYPEISTDYAELLLRTPFMPSVDRRAAMAWLSGHELSEQQLSRLGRATGSGGLSDLDVLPALRTLAIVAAHGAPITLVFDQLENLVDSGGDSGRVIAYGNLVSELFDTVRGLVIVQLALEAEWDRRLGPALSASQRSRVAATSVVLDLPRPPEREELVRAWCRNLPETERNPFPWPFTEAQFSAWRAAPGLTPRMLMIACREAYEAGPESVAVVGAIAAGAPVVEASSSDDVAERNDRLAQLWQAHLRQARAELRELGDSELGLDAERLVSGLIVPLTLAGQAAKARTIKSTPCVVLEGSGRELRIVQQRHPRWAAAALQHAAQSADRVTVLRQRALAFPPTWKKVDQYARELVAAGGRFHLIEGEDGARLIALHCFVASARSQDLAGLDGRPLDPADVEHWVQDELDWRSWPVVQVALGTPPEPTEPIEAPIEAPAEPPPPESTRLRAPALLVLKRLYVASIDRVALEARALDPDASRASVTAELRRAGNHVRWFGRSLVALQEVCQ
jgi:hypothetical protein